jgi:signal peptidase I
MATAKAKTAAATPQATGFKKSTPREYFESLCVAVILALFVRTFVVQAFKIPTGSMENNLLIGDHLLVNKMVFAPTLTRLERAILPADPIRRGDIIVFKYPVEPERDYIKRVIALPGETLELKNKTVYVDGKALEEPYVHYLFPDAVPGSADYTDLDVRRKYGPVTVPADHYFMMGDNRDNSQDSRYWGFMPRSYVKGKALFVYFSFGDATSGLLNSVRWSRLFHQIH